MLKEIITQHWPEGLVATMTGLLTFFSRRELKRNDDRHLAHEQRLKQLEGEVITKNDFDELRSSMTASMTNLADGIDRRMSSMHTENVDTLNRIHTRVDDLWKSHHSKQ